MFIAASLSHAAPVWRRHCGKYTEPRRLPIPRRAAITELIACGVAVKGLSDLRVSN
jgi:hypothetical protein